MAGGESSAAEYFCPRLIDIEGAVSMSVQLLAKRPRDKDNPTTRETLAGHLIDVVRTSGTIIDRYGQDILRGMGLAETKMHGLLRDTLLRASFLHDLGKANSQFQKAVRGKGLFPQAFRHEWLSAWIPLVSPDFRHWLFEGMNELAVNSVLFAVIGHHLKFPDGSVLSPREGTGMEPIGIFLGEESVQACMDELRSILSMKAPPQLGSLRIDPFNKPLKELKSWTIDAIIWFERCSKEERCFIAAVKALLISADVAGSALARNVPEPTVWTNSALERVCSPAIFENIIERSLRGKGLRDFQTRVAESSADKVFLRAGCGSGKTLAAYLWAQRQAENKKLFFCYPTTGTASEGFRDYFLPEEMGIEAELVHSRSMLDIEDLMRSPEEREADVSWEAESEDMAKIDSLVSWGVPITVCTSDQVLGIIQNNRKPLFTFPCIGNSAMVFDEIHQYDDTMFRSLLAFLRAFPDIHILMMTASLQKGRLEALQKTLAELGKPMDIIDGPPELESLKRYHIGGTFDAPPWEEVRASLERGEKVLWVANTVERCVQLAKEAEARGMNPIVYHSRFRYGDRVRRHREAVEAFDGQGAALVMATQVCEVSLDISSQLLVTDLAPPSSLIQRMGRLNRRVETLSSCEAMPVLFLEPDGPRPYSENEMEAARRWIGLLGGGMISQADLDAAFKQISEADSSTAIESKWLDGGPFSSKAPVRDPGYTAPFVMKEDLDACLVDGKLAQKELIRHSIPMPITVRSAGVGKLRRLGYCYIAPAGSIAYSERWGGKWVRL